MDRKQISEKSIKILYLLGLIGMVLILVAIPIFKTSRQKTADYSDYVRIEQGWYTKEGNAIDFSKLGSYMAEDEGVLTICYTLPELSEDVTLFYRSKDVSTKVFMEGEQIYETKVDESPFYNRSPGNLWNMVKLSKEYSGKTVELEITMTYDTSAVTVDHVYLGDKGDIMHSIIESKVGAMLISIVVILLGVVLIFMDVMPFYHRHAENHAAFYLGLYATMVGIWSLLETNVLQFFVEDMRSIQLIDNIVIITDNFPLLLYLNCYYRLFRNFAMRIFCYLQVFYILLCVGMQFSGRMDMHDLLKGSWLFSYSNDVIMAGLVIWMVWNFHKTKTANRRMGIQMLGILIMIVSAFISAFKYTAVDTMDRAQYLRVGMLGFVICLAVSSQLNTYRLMEQGMKYTIVKNLAYMDGLTGLGNRTAYLEKLEVLVKNGNGSLGIVFLDINNLKQVNDHIGHEAGDQLICLAADLIHATFGKEGHVYRIGGDEFCVLIEGETLYSRYKERLSEFECRIEAENKKKDVPFRVQVAQGFSICNQLTTVKIDQTIAEADGRMYSDKARQKEMDKRAGLA